MVGILNTYHHSLFNTCIYTLGFIGHGSNLGYSQIRIYRNHTGSFSTLPTTLSNTTLSHTTFSHTSLSHAALSHTHTHNFVTCNFVAHNFVAQNLSLSLTHISRATLSHTSLSHATLSPTTSHNFVAHNLCPTRLLCTQRLSLSLFGSGGHYWLALAAGSGGDHCHLDFAVWARRENHCTTYCSIQVAPASALAVPRPRARRCGRLWAAATNVFMSPCKRVAWNFVGLSNSLQKRARRLWPTLRWGCLSSPWDSMSLNMRPKRSPAGADKLPGDTVDQKNILLRQPGVQAVDLDVWPAGVNRTAPHHCRKQQRQPGRRGPEAGLGWRMTTRN